MRKGQLVFDNNGTWWTYLGRADGKTQRASTGLRALPDTRAAAEAKATVLRAQWVLQQAGLAEPPKAQAPLFKDWAAKWEREWGTLQRGYEGRIGYRVKQLVAAFGPLRLTALTPSVVHTWRTQRLEGGAAPRTINRDVDLLKSILSKGVPEYYAESPLRLMPRLQAPPPVTQVLTPEHEAKLLSALSDEDTAIFLVALDGLVRLGDVLALRWDDIDLDQWIIRVKESKNGRAYQVPLSTRAHSALSAVRPTRVDRAGIIMIPNGGTHGCFPLVFPTAGGSQRQRVNSYVQRIRRTCQKLGIPFGRAAGGVTFHAATRHTGATRLVAAGVDLRTVQEIGGWSSLSMLQRYVHPTQERLRQAVEKIGGRQ